MTLLAKSGRSPVSLLDHTRAVVAAARTIFDVIGTELPTRVDRHALWKLVLAGAVLHDLGKANNILQGILEGHPLDKGIGQPLRHEGLSALIVAGHIEAARAFSDHLAGELFREWEDPEKARWMLAWVVGGHHLRLHYVEDNSASIIRKSGIPSEHIKFHGDLLAWERWQQEFPDVLGSVPLIPNFIISTDVGGDDSHVALANEFAWKSEDWAESLSPDDRDLLALAKAILIAADVAASALWDGRGDGIARMESGVRESLQYYCLPEKLKGIVRARLRVEGGTDYGTKLHPFQRRVRDALGPRVILEAACGSGKTIAAYEWARKHVEAGRKLVFCYPTTGTAAAGFDDYLFGQGELERQLITSRAPVDIRRMLANEPEGGNRKLRHPSRSQELEDLMKRESLQAWGQQVIAATADFVLGLMQNHRRSLFAFPAIARGAIVFDEVHSYDAKMFDSLMRFLRMFPNTPALLMTASLQPKRRKALKEAGVNCEPISGDDGEETAPRYRLEWLEGVALEDCWVAVRDTLGADRKVLWVCNTVADAVRIYEEAMESGLEPILFHSRYRYRDRVDRQSEILTAFGKDKSPCLAVTTQVCEMSLDISADLLVTALPPFPALVQRMGRLNRRRKHPAGACCLVYDYQGFDGRPYRIADLEASRSVVKELAEEHRVLCQRDLKNALDRMPEADDIIDSYSAWLDGRWESKQATLREGEATVPVLLKEDEEEIHRQIHRLGKDAIKEWLVPILVSMKGVTRIGNIGGYPLVSGVKYDEKGAR